MITLVFSYQSIIQMKVDSRYKSLMWKWVLLFVFLIACNAPAQKVFTIPNSNFEQLDKSSSTKCSGWITGGNSDYCSMDSTVVWKGRYSFHITKATHYNLNTPDAFGLFYRELPFKSSSLKKFRVSGSVKTKNVNEKHVELFVKVTDKEGHVICRQGMSDQDIKRTNEWKIYEAEFYADESAVQIKVGGLLIGTGEAWFDDLAIQEIPFNHEKLTSKISNYIEEYFKIVKTNSIVKNSLLITRLYNRTKQLCAGNPDIKYCHFILQNITYNLNDHHSFFSTPAEWKEMTAKGEGETTGFVEFPNGKLLPGNVAYINLPGFASFDPDLKRRFADTLQTIISKLDDQNPAGWVIDLSKNEGGNCWVMLAGLGPLLGNGTCGYSISANGKKMTRIYQEGWTGFDTTMEHKVSSPYHLKNPGKRIAIIYSPLTVSSGEVVAISFRGKDGTRSFGQPTFGSTTRIDNLPLSDGASLNLASGVDVDRKGIKYGGRLNPDYPTIDTETALKKATEWIEAGTK